MLVEMLALLGLKGVASVGRAVDDAKTKRNTTALDSNGNVTCIGRTGKYYVNGEETYRWTQEDKYGNRHDLTIGVNSGKVYRDNFDDEVKLMSANDEKNKQWSLSHGYLAYNKYDPRFRRNVTTEISTGKVIATLCEGYDNNRANGRYYKFYYKEKSPHYRDDFNKSAPGDYGIEISEDEYNKLNIPTKTCGEIPDDPKVLNKVWGVDCF